MGVLRTAIISFISTCWQTEVAANTCIYVPDEESAAVSACESDESYVFSVAGTEHPYVYAKDAYRARLVTMLNTWLAVSGIEAPEDATIEFWLAVPEANPAAVQGRAVLRSDAFSLVWYLSLHPDEWALADRDVGILTDGPYPQSYGHRPRALLVKATSGDQSERDAVLAAHGALQPKPYAANWSVYDTSPGNEESARLSILADPRRVGLIDAVELNHVVEWIALRELAFTFAFSPVLP